MIKNVSIIGSGNVASHLGKVLFELGYNVVDVFSRDIEHAQLLAAKIGANSVSDFSLISHSSDLYVICVKDDAIRDIVLKMPFVDGLVVHTSGSVDTEILKRFKNYGVLYPFQSITKEKQIDYKQLQLLIDANSDENLNLLRGIAQDISTKVLKISYEQRKQLHIAAVFANNFVNHFYSIAFAFLEEKNLPISLLIPLIEETTEKIKSIDPRNAQTGPAKRGDKEIIEKHLAELENKPDYQLIYRLMTESIQNDLKQKKAD